MNSKSNTSRRRKKDEPAEPIDESIQEQEVAELREEALEQMELIHSIFSRVCEGAMFLSLVLGVASHDLWCWIHVVASIFLHWSAIHISGMSQNSATTQEGNNYQMYLPVIAMIILVILFIPQAMKEDHTVKNKKIAEMDHLHHLGLAGSNAVTMLLALYIKKDNEKTNQQIAQLEKSRYKYKSL
jgi:uncharacterized membrane protein YecN with MAPEG domain